MMRRLLSILLFGAFLLPFLAPALTAGASAESQLPACCRRDGRHHCAMSAEARAKMAQVIGEKLFRAPLEKCPYQQRSLGVVHHDSYAIHAPGVTSVALRLRKPSAAAQAECLRRISFDRSRQKRGPPATQLS